MGGHRVSRQRRAHPGAGLSFRRPARPSPHTPAANVVRSRHLGGWSSTLLLEDGRIKPSRLQAESVCNTKRLNVTMLTTHRSESEPPRRSCKTTQQPAGKEVRQQRPHRGAPPQRRLQHREGLRVPTAPSRGGDKERGSQGGSAAAPWSVRPPAPGRSVSLGSLHTLSHAKPEDSRTCPVSSRPGCPLPPLRQLQLCAPL